ncbi:hypothetical protein IG195_21895 (plasmid) [Arthrobacter sp. TES]|nr:hypothetical protein IG195_21895 [Arthrobacter sp. TES]
MAVIPVVAAVPIAVLASGIRPEQGLTSLFTLGAYGYLGSYILASASLPFFLHRIGENTLANWILAAFTSLIIGVILGYAAKVSVQAGNLVVFIYFGVVLASVVFAALAHHFAPRRLAGVGIYDETRDSDLYEPGCLVNYKPERPDPAPPRNRSKSWKPWRGWAPEALRRTLPIPCKCLRPPPTAC